MQSQHPHQRALIRQERQSRPCRDSLTSGLTGGPGPLPSGSPRTRSLVQGQGSGAAREAVRRPWYQVQARDQPWARGVTARTLTELLPGPARAPNSDHSPVTPAPTACYPCSDGPCHPEPTAPITPESTAPSPLFRRPPSPLNLRPPSPLFRRPPSPLNLRPHHPCSDGQRRPREKACKGCKDAGPHHRGRGSETPPRPQPCFSPIHAGPGSLHPTAPSPWVPGARGHRPPRMALVAWAP